MIQFQCSSCGKKLRIKDESRGKKVKCPGCQQTLCIPAENPVIAATLQANPAAAPRSPQNPYEEKAIAPRSDGPPPPVGDLPTLRPGEVSRTTPGESTARESTHSKEAELTAFLAPPQQADEIGRLGPYRILKILGAGGMGVVYKAEDPHLERAIALKAMLPSLSTNAESRQRFLREAKASAAVKHDNIVTIHQVGEERGVPFLAMEFLEGQSLDERLRKEKQTAASPDRAPRHTDRRGAGRRSRARSDPSRHQAGQYLAGGQPRPRQNPRFRFGPSRRRPTAVDPTGRPPWHTRFHGAGADRLQSSRCPLRSVQSGLHPLSNVYRKTTIPSRRRNFHAPGCDERKPQATPRTQPNDPACPFRSGDETAGQNARGPTVLGSRGGAETPGQPGRQDCSPGSAYCSPGSASRSQEQAAWSAARRRGMCRAGRASCG